MEDNAFFNELKELCKKYEATIWSCGCCHSISGTFTVDGKTYEYDNMSVDKDELVADIKRVIG